MVREGIVLDHKISKEGLEVDKAKVSVIEKLLMPINVKGIRSFLGHAGFYRSNQTKKGTENQVADHLSRLNDGKADKLEEQIKDAFPDEQLFVITIAIAPWYADIANYIVSGILPNNMSSQQRNRFIHDCKYYLWDEPYLFKRCPDQIIRRCVPEGEIRVILEHCHSSPYRGHYARVRTAAKILQSGFYWPNISKDSHSFVSGCDRC
ncbi:uncharacterized protein LOC133294952 [Gastrolobium bilobum]|uniref:uncharacterized protein LOC133294952 n=1 Tax=Gastrolobium bilobum TaxID=150636 RepID=UPI002AB279CF|nr:uncharacterized protein LOC133294952 [Gastrolobium bilobum]